MPISNLISVTEIDTMIITCSADIDHKDEITSHIKNFNAGQRGRDYLEIALPGAFPTPDSFSVIKSLILRYKVKVIAIISHTDCGLTLAVKKRIDSKDITPRLFTVESEKVFDAIDTSDNTEKHISICISKLISKTVANQLLAEAQTLRTKAYESSDPDQELEFAEIFENIDIVSFSSIHEEGYLELVSGQKLITQYC